MLKKTKSVIAISLMLCFLMPVLVSTANAETDKWTTLEAMLTPRSSFGAAVVDGKIYAIGGHNGSILGVNEMYDPTTDTWTTKTPLPTPRHSFGIAVYQNKIYVIGGVFNSSTPFSSGVTGITEVYDPTTDMWETKESMPTPRADLGANVVGDKIYLIGGTKYVDVFPFNTAANVNEVYYPTNDSWTTRTSIPRGCFEYASATVGNKIYVMGGWVYQTHNLNQIYDTEADTWSYGKNLTSGAFTSGAGITSGILAPERIYVIGTQNQPNTAANYTQLYDMQNDTWTFATSMPTARYGLEVAVVNDELYAIGGRNEDTFLGVNEKYTPQNYIPEFSSETILLTMFLTTTLVGVLYQKKCKHNTKGAK